MHFAICTNMYDRFKKLRLAAPARCIIDHNSTTVRAHHLLGNEQTCFEAAYSRISVESVPGATEIAASQRLAAPKRPRQSAPVHLREGDWIQQPLSQLRKDPQIGVQLRTDPQTPLRSCWPSPAA
ncbi:unnamed protein product [Durusdinium trenchii]|uniref:Uncharacterized protein n=1 Tax=Durusdinium trenchii TaxID=1381693 RepID=A0ABP0MJL7_9DINO